MSGTPKPRDVLVAVIVHVPHLLGYFRDRLSVIRLSAESLFKHTPSQVCIMFFDNGSCPEASDLLSGYLAQGKIDLLLRSSWNIGKLAAMGMIFRAAPRPVVALADDDIFYYPGWLEAQLQVLAAFPRVGMVSGVPTADGATHGMQTALTAAERQDVQLLGHRSPTQDWERDWAMSTGRDPAEYLRRIQDFRLPHFSCGGVQALGGATHFQFLAFRDRLLECLPAEWPANLMGGMRELDAAADRAGYLRLSTTRRYVRHIGNRLHQEILGVAQELDLPTEPPLRLPRFSMPERLAMRVRRVRSWVWRLYRRIGLLIDGPGVQPGPARMLKKRSKRVL